MNIKELIEKFNVVEFLSTYNIEYAESGAEISRDYVGVYSCPFCGKENYHAGINKIHKGFNCWICRGHSLWDYIKVKLKTNNRETFGILNKFQGGDVFRSSFELNFRDECQFPVLEDGLSLKFKRYLKKRGYPLRVISKYKLKSTGIKGGKFKHRLIFPYYLDHKPVTYVGRSITVKSYLDCPIENSKIFPKGTLFNFDALKNNSNCLITEGVFDCLRIGDGCVSTSGTNWTDSQVRLLLQKNPKQVFICFDNEPEAQEKALSLAGNLSLIVDQVERVFLPDNINDIGDLSSVEGDNIRKQLKLKGEQF